MMFKCSVSKFLHWILQLDSHIIVAHHPCHSFNLKYGCWEQVRGKTMIISWTNGAQGRFLMAIEDGAIKTESWHLSEEWASEISSIIVTAINYILLTNTDISINKTLNVHLLDIFYSTPFGNKYVTSPLNNNYLFQ